MRLAIIVFGLVGAGPLHAQSTDRELIAARDTVWRAFFQYDTATLRRYLPPATTAAEGRDGSVWKSRTEIMNASREFVRSKSRLVDVKFENTQIAYGGHTAILRSTYTTIIESSGRTDTARGRATELFVRQGRAWVNPYWQLETGQPGGEREIELPDTLGANFSIADSAAMSGTPADYDALIGTWEFRMQGRNSDGGYWAPFTGHWTFAKVPGGGLVEDQWRPDDASLSMAQSLHTYRTFDPKRKVWQMVGSSPTGGEVEPGLTWSDSNGRYAIQRNRGVLTRIRYLSIEANRFLWRSDVSTDGGNTWRLDASFMEARRIGK
jgi:hypothetical protein